MQIRFDSNKKAARVRKQRRMHIYTLVNDDPDE